MRFKISYKGHSAIKAQTLADFVAELSDVPLLEEKPNTEYGSCRWMDNQKNLAGEQAQAHKGTNWVAH